MEEALVILEATATFRWQRDTAACLATLPDHASNGQVGNKLEHRRSVSSWGRDRRHRLLLGLDGVKLYLEIQVGCLQVREEVASLGRRRGRLRS